MKRIVSPTLDKHFPWAGPCALCGHVDRRHRTWDALMDAADHGRSVREIASWHEVPLSAVRKVLRVRPYKRARK